MTLREQVEAIRPKDGEPGRHVTREMLIALCDATLKVGEMERELEKLRGLNASMESTLKSTHDSLDAAARSLEKAERERDEARARFARCNEERERQHTRADEATERAESLSRSLAGMREACAKVCDEIEARWHAKRMALKDRHGSDAAYYLNNAFAVKEAGQRIRALPDVAGGGETGGTPDRRIAQRRQAPTSYRLSTDARRFVAERRRAPIRARTETAWLIERKPTRWDKDRVPMWWWGWGHAYDLDDPIGWTKDANQATKFTDAVSAQNALWTLMTMAGVPKRGQKREWHLEHVTITEHEWPDPPAVPRAAPEEAVRVPREPTEEMLRAALDARYCRSARSRNVKEKFPAGYETWIRVGLIEDAPAIREEYKAMIAAAPKEPR